MKKTIASVLVLGGLLALAGCSREEQVSAAAPEVVRGVHVETVQPVTVPEGSDAVGTVRAQQTAQLSAQIFGEVRQVRALEGAKVRGGDVLVVLDSAQQQAGLEGAKAAIAAARQEIEVAEADSALADSTVRRYQPLSVKEEISGHQMDEVKARARAASARRDMAHAQLAQAEAGLAQARTMHGYTQIRAPFDGVVTAKLADPGAMASPGTPLLTVEDTRKFRLEVTVDESKIAEASLGESVPVSLDALGDATLQAKVVQIVPAADPGSRSFLVKLELPSDARIRSGLFGRAMFAHGTRQAVMLPKTSVINRGQLQGVYVVGGDQIADLRYVTLGRASGDKVEVLSGLQTGDRVVIAPGDHELAGKKVE